MSTELRGSSPGTGCKAPKTGALMSVVISGLVKSSKMPGVHNGSTVNIQFLAEPQGLIREIPGQGVVYDGISPYKVCPEDFDVKFSTGVKGRFIPEKKGLWEKKVSRRSVRASHYHSPANGAHGPHTCSLGLQCVRCGISEPGGGGGGGARGKLV